MTPTPATFGEPWSIGTNAFGDGRVVDCDGKIMESDEVRARAITCVNALAGIPDPAAFREAVMELVEAVKDSMMPWPIITAADIMKHRDRVNVALSKVESQIQKQEGNG